MTKNEFVNLFIRHNKIKKTIILELCVFLFASVLLTFGANIIETEISYIAFAIGWFGMQLMTGAFWFFLSFKDEKAKFNNELCRDIIE